MNPCTFHQVSPCTATADCQSGDGRAIVVDGSWNLVSLSIDGETVALSARDAAQLGAFLIQQAVAVHHRGQG